MKLEEHSGPVTAREAGVVSGEAVSRGKKRLLIR